MEALAVWMLAIAVADLVGGATEGAGGVATADADGADRDEADAAGPDDATTPHPPWWPSAALVVVALVGAALSGLPADAAAVAFLVTFLTGGLWLWLRYAEQDRWALAVLVATLAGLTAVADQWGAGPAPALLGLPDPAPAVPAEYALLIAAIAVFLLATGNRIVRIVLGGLDTGVLDQEDHLRGGRLIGPLERLLIFGLGMVGQLTAAAIVVAAKSLLRFGEVRDRRGNGPVGPASPDGLSGAGAAADDPGEAGRGPSRAELMSEYLLVGSLLSWSLAFLAVGLAWLLRP